MSYHQTNEYGHSRRDVLKVQERWRISERKQLLQRLDPQSDDRIFDIGCSSGHLLNILQRKYNIHVAVGCDNDLEVADPKKGIFHLAAENLEGIPDDRFTKVVVSHALEHVEDIDAVLQEARRILVDGGELHIAVFLHNNETIQHPTVRTGSLKPPTQFTVDSLVTQLEQNGFVVDSDIHALDKQTTLPAEFQIPSVLIKAYKVTGE